MPLLRRKPFIGEKPPSHLKATDEVFYCEMTGEVFDDYEAFYQRMILCNSLVWSCELSQRSSLTYKEALESEEHIRETIKNFPVPLKRAILTVVHHIKHLKLQSLCDELYDFLKLRYQINETVETKVRNIWTESRVIKVSQMSDVSQLCRLSASKENMSPLKSPNKSKSSTKSPLGKNSTWQDPKVIEYKVEILEGSMKDATVSTTGAAVRRQKNVFLKEKLRVFLKQTCIRTHAVSDTGFWVVKANEVLQYGLGDSSIARPPVVTPKKRKKKKKKAKDDIHPDDKPLKELAKKKENKSEKVEEKKDNEKPLQTLMEKRKEMIREKERKKKELEEEKLRKKDEKEKEKEMLNEVRKVEAYFKKNFSKPREDLMLEDLKPLPTLVPFKCQLNSSLVGDAMMVVEFVNTFDSLLAINKQLDDKVSLKWVEDSLTEHDAEGKYFQLLKALLHSYLLLEQEENKEKDEDTEDEDEEEGDDDSQKTAKTTDTIINEPKEKTSLNSRAAAAWPVLHQGMALHEIPIEPFSLSEILRLHILSSDVKIGVQPRHSYNEWTQRGQPVTSDNPCVPFRHNEIDIMLKLVTKNIYDFSPEEKLKILVLLCDQCLMLGAVRDQMEDATEKLKDLRKQLRDVHSDESKRKQMVRKEKWKRVQAEREKKKQEIKKRKEERLLELQNKTENQTATLNDEPTTKTPTESREESTKKEEEAMERELKREVRHEQSDDFYHDKFLFRESAILNEISTASSVFAKRPIGHDRCFRRYWKFEHIDGMYIENDQKFVIDSVSDFDDDETDMSSEDEDSEIMITYPKISLKDLIKTKENNEPFEQKLFQRYKVPFTSKTSEALKNSTYFKSVFESVRNGLNPDIYCCRDSTQWSMVTSKEQLETLVDNLNIRGRREKTLKLNLCDAKEKLLEVLKKMQVESEKPAATEVAPTKPPKKDPNEIDKKMFKTMEHFIEANLRDQLVEFEERLWVAGLGGHDANSREEWRVAMEDEMMKLIVQENGTAPPKVNGENGVNVVNGHHKEENEEKPAVAAHLKEDRCSTPVPFASEDDNQVVVNYLAEELLKLMETVELKYLKPPLGETEEARKMRLKEQAKKKDSEEEKKPSTCLSRWQESLLKCTSFAQVFVHLQTFDRSIMWNKSVQNVKCKTCRRKGNEEEMLLCDGCDRGFHMSCLKPLLKRIPQGDWYCSDCRPMEVKKRSRKMSTKTQENTEEEEEEKEEEEGSDEEEEENESGSDESESESGTEEDTEDSDGSDASEHAEECTICADEGTLLLCEECPRGFHVECVHPPIRKVPRGKWTCQICRNADTDLPIRKRAITIEKNREKEERAKLKKQQQASKPPPAKSKPQKRANSQEEARPSKKAKLEDSQTSSSQGSSQATSQRLGMSRQQLKQCSVLITDVFKHENADVFLFPVDLKTVPDYTQFIDSPMDFGTIKNQLNEGAYTDVQDFLADISLVFTNCDTYNPLRSSVCRDAAKLKSYVNKRIKELKIE